MDKFFKKLIGKSIAKKMTKAYYAKKRVVFKLNENKKKLDTLSVWISRDNYESFFNDENQNANGVRIYLGVTGKYKGEDGDSDYECKPRCHNQTNLIFVPTTSNGQDPTVSKSRNMILNTDKSTLVVLCGRIDDDHDLCPHAPDGSNNFAEIN
jgi:hypothetical protein